MSACRRLWLARVSWLLLALAALSAAVEVAAYRIAVVNKKQGAQVTAVLPITMETAHEDNDNEHDRP